MNMLRICGLAAALACAPFASGEGLYFGASFGTSSVDGYGDYVTFFDDGSWTSATVDDSDTMMRYYLGYHATENFALQIGYIDLGEARTDAVSNGCCAYLAGPVTHTLSVDGIEISFVGKATIGESGGVFVRFGSLKWDGSESLADSSNSISGTASGNDTFFGFGASYELNERWTLAGEYTAYSLDAFDVTTMAVSLEYSFGN